MATFTQLLAKLRSERLGKYTDIEEVLSHPWFEDLDTQALLAKKYIAPYIPNIADHTEKPVQRACHSFIPQPARELIQGQKDVFEAFGAYVETDSESDESDNEGSRASDIESNRNLDVNPETNR